MMCKDHDHYNPVETTTIFRPSDTKAVCLVTVSINSTIEFKWYYRSNSSKAWVSCYNYSMPSLFPGEYREYHYVGFLNIKDHWPGLYYPRAYKVDVYLDGFFAFSDFFEVTNGGLNSPRICGDIGVNGQPVDIKSRFTISVDTEAYHYLRFDKIAYFNEELGCCHNFTTVWIQPNGSVYKTYSGNFTDYKDSNATWNYWEYNFNLQDYISINSSTPIGNWKIKVYLDRYYFNSTWMHYGPIATTPFIVEDETVADWTFMVYLDADNSLEKAGISIFNYTADVGSSSQVNIVVQMDKNSTKELYEADYNWTDCKRFYITKDMTPVAANAIEGLGEVNMGHPDTLRGFINWTIENYPANHYFLALWDHGTGCMGICFDTTNGEDYLSLPELSQALSGLPVVIDVIFVDACSMNMIEVAYQIRDYANVLVGPEGLGYAPPPYDRYLSSLTSNSSMSPSALAGEIVTNYIDWCTPIADIGNATMSAVDLTRINNLMAIIDDFALKLKKKEILYHEKISLARNLTETYPGPTSDESGYYIDLYHFAQLIYQHVPDSELRDTANQMIATLSIGNAIVMESNKALPNSHGLSMYFPNERGKYDTYKSYYENMAFAKDTPWDEFVKHYLDIQKLNCVLTIDTSPPYSNIKIEFDEESYTTDSEGKLELFVLPGSYTVNVPNLVLTQTSGSRGVFIQWDDGEKSNVRTIIINVESTLKAIYETQYYLTVSTDPSGLTPQPNISPSGPWYNKSASIRVTAQEISGYVFDHWTVDGTSRDPSVKNITVTMDKPHEAIAHYALPRSWLENLLNTADLKVILAIIGLTVTFSSLGTAWLRTRRRKGVMKAWLDKTDETYSNLKTDPQECEDELCRLRNRISEELADGKITEESHKIIDKRIDKYIEEVKSDIEARAELGAIEVSEFALPDRVTTGYADLDNLLYGGMPKNYSVILTSPSCDERDLLIKKFLETGAKRGEATFYITTDPGKLGSLSENFQPNFHLLILNPQADRIIKSLPNIFKLEGVENLTDIGIALTKAFRRLDPSTSGPKRACIEIISDVLLQHHAVQTRRFLTELITELKSRGFTTLAVMNPKMHPQEEVHAILDLFEGEINIYEKETKKGLEKFLKIKKMYNQKYSEREISLKKEKLET
jgi:KaiC/GvpD/RAD55 family RecA-like ATPase